MCVQVPLTDALPPGRIATLGRGPTLLCCFLLMCRTAATSCQFGAPGDRARGAGLTGHGGTSKRVKEERFGMTYSSDPARRQEECANTNASLD